MLKRKIYDDLVAWKQRSGGTTALLIDGARRVGKSFIAKEFAENEYKSHIIIDFGNVPKDVLDIFENDSTDLDMFFAKLSVFFGVQLYNRESLIVFDEVQQFPRARQLIKYLVADGRYDYLETGSLIRLKKNVKDIIIPSEEEHLEMFPLDFEEFLWAKGYSEKHIEDILQHMQTGTPFSETELSVYKKLFLEYCVLGGMPAVVKVYIEKNLFTDTLEIQRQIQMDYEEDIRKYAEGLDQTKIVSVYRNVPVQLAKENKKFQLSKIDKKARSREYMGCITWLEDAGVISVCYCLQYPELPLKGNYDDSKFKIYYPDTGLLIASLDEEAQEDLRANKNLGVYKGALYENFVAEAFVKQGLGLYYYKKENATLEEDFFVRTKDELVPVEVKANRNRSKSLRQLISGDSYGDIHWGIKLADSNIGIEDGIYTFPYFCTFLLKRYLKGK